MHKRRKRGLTKYEKLEHAGLAEPFLTDKKRALSPDRIKSLHEWDRLREAWDAKYADAGEGPAQVPGGEILGTYKAISVLNSAEKVAGTFFLFTREEKVWELFIATPQRGLPPNPYVRSPLNVVRWKSWLVEAAAKYPDAALNPNPKNANDMRPYSELLGGVDWTLLPRDEVYVFSGLWDAMQNEGQRPVTGVALLPANNCDHRFKFRDGTDGFTVRGSKLAPALLAVRQAGERKIPLHTLRQVIARL
ncbi:hypothetical protein QQO25_08545 [Corynebacterium lehmanniae]|nr:hypothetical protein [Corynebacterium lehmanniae]